MKAHPRILALFGSTVLFGQERGNIEALGSLQEQGSEVLCLIRDEEWSVHIAPAMDSRGLAWLKVPYIEHRMPGRMHYVLFRNPVAFIRANWRFFRVVRDFRPTHIHAFNQLYVLNFLLGLSLVPTPLIYRAGDEPTVHNWIWRGLWRFVVRRTEHFVANSQFVANSLIRHGAPKEKVSVIYNAPPMRSQSTNSGEVFPVKDALFHITYVGQISEHKGIHLLIRAFCSISDEFPDSRLTIAGRISDWSGDDWARELRAETISNPAIGHRVSFVGEISNVNELMTASSVHVAPSLFEDPSPNVIMEAKQAGCPSVVFPRGGMPELVETGIDGIVCQDATVESLADALRFYIANPEVAKLHGKAAWSSLERLGVTHFAETWQRIYTNSHLGNRSSTSD